jgi:hypothetical protein
VAAHLILKRASVSQPSGEWNDDDFGVLADGAVVGCIFKADAAPVGAPWFWTVLNASQAAFRRPLPHQQIARAMLQAMFSWNRYIVAAPSRII